MTLGRVVGTIVGIGGLILHSTNGGRNWAVQFADVPAWARLLGAACWPGPLTLVLPRGPRAGDHVGMVGLFPPLVIRMLRVGERTGMLPEVIAGMTEASATRRRPSPRTRSLASTTAPMAQVPAGWYTEFPLSRA